jgi:hypothetical protein
LADYAATCTVRGYLVGSYPAVEVGDKVNQTNKIPKIENLDDAGLWKVLLTRSQAFLIKEIDGSDVIFGCSDLKTPGNRTVLNRQDPIYHEWYADKSLVNRFLEIVRQHNESFIKPEPSRM